MADRAQTTGCSTDCTRKQQAAGYCVEAERLRAALAEANDAAEANAAWGGRMKQERDALRDAWLRVIQADNTCAVNGRPCDAKRCGCAEEQEMFIREAADGE